MVDAGYNGVIINWFFGGFWRQQRYGAVYLYIILDIPMADKKTMQTILVIVTGFTVVFILSRLKTFLSLAIIVSVGSLLSDYVAGKIAWAWDKLAEGLGFVTSKILLTMVFFIFLTPVAALARLFSKKDSLQLKKSSGSSYYIAREHAYIKNDLENVW